jgi:glycosyltransferase involved in cell wall biosynthesis
MKVLMSAYACEPGKGSEPGVGWNWALQAARFHDVWVVTRANNRDAIEAELARNPVPNLRFFYHDLPRWGRFWKKGHRGVHLYYLLWQLTAVPVGRRLHRDVGFDVGHHVTFVSFRSPSFLAALPIPYVWGPVGGGERAPRRFYRTFGVAGAAKQLLRDLSNALTRVDPLVRATARRACVILVTTPATADALSIKDRARARLVPAVGEPARACPTAPAVPASDGLRVLYVGNLIYWKGVHLALAAVARCTRTVSFTVVAGRADERERLERLVRRLGIGDRVRFMDALTHAEALAQYDEHDVFLFPSFQDSGGGAVLEAMAAGLPVVCLDLGGPAVSVTSETGILVPARNPAQVIRALAAGLETLAADPALRRRMGEEGRRRVTEEYSWDSKGELLCELYAYCHEGKSAEPCPIQ